MFGIGMSELLIILGLALILIGPRKLPELARSLGKTMGELRRATDDLKETMAEEIEPIKEEIPDKEELKEALEKRFLAEEEEQDTKTEAEKDPEN